MRYLRNFKKATLLVIHGAMKQFEKNLVNEQEILNNISDMMMEIYVAESMALRVEKLRNMKGEEAVSLYMDILDVYIYDIAGDLTKSGCDAANSLGHAEVAAKLNGMIESCTRVAPVNVKEARRRIAAKLIDDNAYKF